MTRVLRAAGVGAVVALAAACGASSPLPPGANKLTVVVLVVDSLMPQEIADCESATTCTASSTPNISALKRDGTFYPESRAVYAAETIPNHVAMMTGVYPGRNGIPTNDFIDVFGATAAATTKARLSIPEKLTANTLFTWIHNACVVSGVNPGLRTGATLSKKYLFDIFRGDALNPARANDNPLVFNLPPDSYWDPTKDSAYITAPDEHTPDIPTMTQALTQLPDVDFFFINLGDVDRSAHAGGQSARNGVMVDTDDQVGNLVSALQTAGRWANTVLFLVSDHGMDYTAPGPAQAISTQAALDGLGACFGAMKAVPSGQGTEGISYIDRGAPLATRQAALRAARACLLNPATCASQCAGAAQPANAALIEGAWYTLDDPADKFGNMPASIASKSANLGDLTVFAAAGGKFAEPNQSDSGGVIPGNHGHPTTLRNTFIVAGGSPWVKKGQVIAPSIANPTVYDRLPEQSENTDIAPTVAWLLGLGLRDSDFPDYAQYGKGFDGRVLQEAFTQFDADPYAPPPTACGRFD